MQKKKRKKRKKKEIVSVGYIVIEMKQLIT